MFSSDRLIPNQFCQGQAMFQIREEPLITDKVN